MAILLSGRPTTLRFFAAGLALGFAAAVSAKTILLLAAIIAGVIAAREARLKQIAVFLLAFAIPPAAVAAYFASVGAWQPFVYGAIAHNVLRHPRIGRVILFPFLLVVIGAIGHRVADSPRRMFLFIAIAPYLQPQPA